MRYESITELSELRSYLSNATVVAFDIETAPIEPYRTDEKAALDAHKSQIVGISFSVEEASAVYIPLAHKTGENFAEQYELWSYLKKELFENTTVIKVAHNLAFESMFMYARGIVIQPPCYDTIAAAQMTLKSNTKFRNLSDSGLKTLVPSLLDIDLPSFSEVTDGKTFDELNPQDEETVRYACADSDFALRLYHMFNDWFDRFLPKHRFIVEQVESPTAVYVGIMKYNGLLVDRNLMLQKQSECESKLNQLRQEIAFIMGDVNIGANASTSAFKKYLYQDLQLPVFKTTSKYQEAIDDESLILLSEWCAENRPELVALFKLVQDYRRWGKVQSTYIDGYLRYINTATGRIHPELFPLGTESGRFCCRNPNLQNQSSSASLPVNVRSFFIAPEGCVLLEADYSQIELRVAAYLSQDETMLDAYRNKADIHALTTAAIYNISLDEAADKHHPEYKKRRTAAKATIFGVLYGIYKRGLEKNLRFSAGVDITVDECDEFIRNLKSRYPTLALWQNDSIREAGMRRYAETRLGRRRYVPLITSDDYVKRGGAERAALNHGVQGLAADMLKLSMGRLLKVIHENDWLIPILTVHDSLVFTVPEERVQDAKRLVKECMEVKPPLEDFNIPVTAEVSAGKDYSHMEEE